MIDPRRAMAAIAWCAAAGFAAAPGCAGILDLGDFRDAVAELCVCEEVPQFGGNCEEVLTERLEAVSPPTRELWLDFYANNCAQDCTKARSCYDQEATCIFDTSCSFDEECCNWTDGGTVSCASPTAGGGKVCQGNN